MCNVCLHFYLSYNLFNFKIWSEQNKQFSGSFDFIENTNLINEIEADYELIRSICIKSGFTALSGKQGKWIQPRTKGAGHGSTSRAFYAKKGLIKEIIKFGKDE